MSPVQTLTTFEPAELVGTHYRPVGGKYASMELAVEAIRAYSRNTHGGVSTFRVYESREGHGDPAIVEVTVGDRDPHAIQGLYKVFESPTTP